MKHKKEHKKGQESTIGKIIYGFLLFMPLFAILSTILYTTFNKNAYRSYSGYKENERTYEVVNDKTDFDVNNIYYLSLSNQNITNNIGNNTNRLYFTIEEIINNTSTIDLTNARSVGFYNSNNSLYTYWYDINNISLGTINFASNYLVEMNIKYVSNTLANNNVLEYGIISKIEYNDNYYIDNSFYYAVDKVENSNLFNWAENSIIYTTMNATCTQLSITTPFIPLLLSYWLIISVIYFLYDIALMLIWALHDRIHEMKESIS